MDNNARSTSLLDEFPLFQAATTDALQFNVANISSRREALNWIRITELGLRSEMKWLRDQCRFLEKSARRYRTYLPEGAGALADLEQSEQQAEQLAKQLVSTLATLFHHHRRAIEIALAEQVRSEEKP